MIHYVNTTLGQSDFNDHLTLDRYYKVLFFQVVNVNLAKTYLRHVQMHIKSLKIKVIGNPRHWYLLYLLNKYISNKSVMSTHIW